MAQDDVIDCHFAIMKALRDFPYLDGSRVALVGYSYGGFVASHLAIMNQDMYKVLVLLNPIVDLAAMASTSSVSDWVWQMLGLNYSHSSVATDIYIDAWHR